MNKIKRTINGILLVNKPAGLTSNAVLQKVKRLYQARKAGHTGSLDPLATGMLPVCFGEATKFAQHLLDADKYYRVVAKLGYRTSTGDSEGEVVEQKTVPVMGQQQWDNIVNEFKGQITQIPPMYSALKKDGKPLYFYARQGIEVERKERIVEIKQLTLLDYNNETFTLEVHCSKGTYIRTLVEDIGATIGCGAHVIKLHRLATTPYENCSMYNFEQLEKLSLDELDDLLLPLDSALKSWPTVDVDKTLAQQLLQGQKITLEKALQPGLVKLMLENEHFLGIGQIENSGVIVPKRLIQQKGKSIEN